MIVKDLDQPDVEGQQDLNTLARHSSGHRGCHSGEHLMYCDQARQENSLPFLEWRESSDILDLQYSIGIC